MAFTQLYQRGEYVRERVTAGLGEQLLSQRISLKQYPCGRNLHGLLDATVRARLQHAGRSIERIDVYIDARSFARANLIWPEHVVAAQFSVPFVVALSTAAQRTSLSDFAAPSAVPQSVKSLGARVHVQPHDAAAEADRIVFTYAGGETHTESTTGVRLGHPDNPLSVEQIGAKLRDCNTFAGAVLSSEQVEAVLNAALGIAELPSTTALTSLLRV